MDTVSITYNVSSHGAPLTRGIQIALKDLITDEHMQQLLAERLAYESNPPEVEALTVTLSHEEIPEVAFVFKVQHRLNEKPLFKLMSRTSTKVAD